jgi:acetoin utilization deacetylase AcuC-like enzyme
MRELKYKVLNETPSDQGDARFRSCARNIVQPLVNDVRLGIICIQAGGLADVEEEESR